ncbi:hypothetical protein PR202_ga11856 [Eleusine coracana subsp. coracana]|uniref:Uncharacterized protein n=1 Tax=Eleusine coracana subsp. coracana TaxID=191504 RepID=A0AAV5CAL1_ELECO|nr:hypothetical protein PR202_ga11856 [Eleusine coracana subsp. coracana]
MPTRMKGLIGGWSGREASCAGREILLKSVAQAVPTYSMSCFLLPKSTCKEMRQVIANYWWGSSADSRRIHWLRWDRLTWSKCKGGMGFRDLYLFNLSMLGKQGWRLITRPESLCARVLRGRYFHDSDFMECTRKKKASFTWRAIMAGREALKLGMVKRIGDGETTKIWKDRWILNHFSGKPITPEEGQTVIRVSELMDAHGNWDDMMLRQHFIDIDTDAILHTPTRGAHQDVWAWELEKHGMYSVKSAYKLLDARRHQTATMTDAGPSNSDTWKQIWKLEVPAENEGVLMESHS